MRIKFIALPTQRVAVSTTLRKPIATSKTLHRPFPINSTALHVPSQRWDTAEGQGRINTGVIIWLRTIFQAHIHKLGTVWTTYMFKTCLKFSSTKQSFLNMQWYSKIEFLFIIQFCRNSHNQIVFNNTKVDVLLKRGNQPSCSCYESYSLTYECGEFTYTDHCSLLQQDLRK